MSKSVYDVLGLGSVTVDFVAIVKNWPAEGQKQPLENLSIHDGGLVGTALVAAARLGGNTGFIGKLGFSDMAKRAIEAFKTENIDTSFVIRENKAEPIVAFVFTNSDSGHRNIFWTRQSVQYPMPDELEQTKWYEKTKVLMIDDECGLAGIKAAQIAREHNIDVVIDIEQDTEYTRKALEVANHIVVSQDFAQPYTGLNETSEMLTKLQTSKDQTVVITRGDKGCITSQSGKIFEISGYKVNVVDTTGCGDVFHGTYALAIAQGKSVTETCEMACAAGAMCATKTGGRDGIPNPEQLKNFIEQNS